MARPYQARETKNNFLKKKKEEEEAANQKGAKSNSGTNKFLLSERVQKDSTSKPWKKKDLKSLWRAKASARRVAC